jgi:Flp pilus assembly protein TadD
MRDRFGRFRPLASVSALAILAAALGGCASSGSKGGQDVTGSLSPPRSEAEWRRTVDADGARYRNDPKDAAAALRYGQALRALGQRAQAVAVLEQATIANPGDRALLALYGRALADNGNYQQAFDTLARAHTPDNPDWSILSAQGTALDRLGRHDEARRYYANALKIRPDEPSVLSNLGMSYVLSKDLQKAEATLRSAQGAGDPRIRQNLALAVGLQGRRAEAESIASSDLPPEEAAERVASLRQMLSAGERDRTPAARARNARAEAPRS